ncbi:histidine phosphatase family protein [Flexivirga oryzae]|uniref:Broad specificity phosphatase PhoE n=1 Tax=Flexivirga oryzae TaxID=1794944 RepID=A0A839NF44_9MICO|nr:histidine phosphatase family protein [Flexivirga oryzae]MBB2893311.1 broad specificity phosphatase PhoE [Flexivirga oryzae]
MPRSILLVRHGQASFGKSDYDQLSDVGRTQARLLGQFLSTRDITPDRIVTGSLNRQRQTAAGMCVAAGWITPTDVNDSWNELDHVEIINTFKPAYKNMLVLKADMVRTLRPRAAFEDMFTQAIARWASGEHDEDYTESFSAFDTRVRKAMSALLEDEADCTMVVSSVGLISWIVARILVREPWDRDVRDPGRPGTNDLAIESIWRATSMAGYNSGVTRLQLDKEGQPQLLTYNEIGHLPENKLVTVR